MANIDNPAKFLVDTGLLFEINRAVLHPFGVAMAVTLDDDGKYKESFGLLDARDDPEGWVFDDASFAECEAKYAAFGKAERDRIFRRLDSLGFIRQPRTTGVDFYRNEEEQLIDAISAIDATDAKDPE